MLRSARASARWRRCFLGAHSLIFSPEPARDDFRVAAMTEQKLDHAGSAHFRLEDRYVLLVIAVGTYVVRGLRHALRFLERINEDSLVPHRFQFITRLVHFPCFMAFQLAFQVTHSFQQRELIRLSVNCARLCGYDLRLQVSDQRFRLGTEFGFRESTQYAGNCPDSRPLDPHIDHAPGHHRGR